MNDKYIPIRQDIVVGGGLELERLTDCSQGLILELRSGDGSIITVIFEGYLSYRRIDEGDALLTLSRLATASGGGAVFYVVDTSSFLAWFHEQSFGIRQSLGLRHFAIHANNDIIDIISDSEPTIHTGGTAGRG